MPISWSTFASLTVLTFRGWFAVSGWLDQVRKAPLQPELRPFAEPGYLAAYHVTLRNRSDETIHLREVTITRPAHAAFGFRHWVPLTIIGETPSPDEPWEVVHAATLDHDLDPHDDIRFDIAIPQGFAIGPNRTASVCYTA